MCDAFCVLGDGVTLFAKNSDRPRSEPQVVTAPDGRRAGETLRTQYLDIADAGAGATVLSRPTWLWGAEHGLNEHRVAIGNEMVFTATDPRTAPAALIGMDLVRLGLETGRTAEHALDVITTLLARHGQGGIGDETHGLAYWSSFLIADPTSAWILETSGSTWAARPVAHGAAISNRLTIRRDWTRASADVAPGTDVDTWRHRSLPTGFADTRLAAARAFVDDACSGPSPDCDPRAAVGILRDHGTGPWGVPGVELSSLPPAAPVVDEAATDGRGWTLCLHAGDTAVTTASMVALLPADPAAAPRAWMALGSPCVSVYVPVPGPLGGAGSPPPGSRSHRLPPLLSDPELWHRFASLRDAVGHDAERLAVARAELSPIEGTLWDEADGLAADVGVWEEFGARAGRSVAAGLDRLAAVGLGRRRGSEEGPLGSPP